MSEEKNVEDPCAEFGPAQRAALVWFAAVIVIGMALTYKLAGIDRWMFVHNAETLDYHAYKENRRAATTIASEQLDERQAGDYVSAIEKLSHSER